MIIPRIVAVSGGFLLLTLLSGCSLNNEFSILDGEQSSEDELPNSFNEIDMGLYDISSARFSASYDGIDYFVIREADGGAPCLAASADSESSVSCSSGSGVTVLEVPGRYKAQLVPAPAIDGDGWVAISENVRVTE